MMKKRLITLILCFTLIILSSCSNNGSDISVQDDDSVESYNAVENSDSVEYDRYDVSWITADSVLDFSEGKAWIQNRFNDEAKTVDTVCIDKEGRTLFSVPGDVVYASPFDNDIAYVVKKESDSYSYVILNSSGDELYSSSDAGQEEHILAYGDEKFVVLRHKADINTNEWTLGTIDARGNTIDAFKSYRVDSLDSTIDYDIDDDFIITHRNFDYRINGDYLNRSYGDRYLGEDSFYLNSEHKECIYNPVKGTCIDVEPFEGEASNGYLTQPQNNTSSGELRWYRVDISTGEDIGPLFELKTNYGYKTTESGMKNGLIYFDHGFYDINGNERIHIKGYDDKDIYCTPFNGEYAIMKIKGADGERYVTLVNRSGESLFEPFKSDMLSQNNDNGYFVSGYNNNYAIFDKKGNQVKALDFDSLYNARLAEGFVLLDQYEGHISNGMHLIKIPNY